MKPLTLEETGIKTDDNEMCIKGIDELPIFSWNTKTKEFYVLGHKFDGINSIEDFINYIHNLDKENKSLQSQLKSKEEENQELKLELSGYRQAILEDKEMLGLKEENDKLKKQLEENKDNYNCLLKQKEQFEYIMSKQVDYQGQQKEFINYLEDKIKSYKSRDSYMVADILGSYDLNNIELELVEEILQKCKEIIGVSNEY